MPKIPFTGFPLANYLRFTAARFQFTFNRVPHTYTSTINLGEIDQRQFFDFLIDGPIGYTVPGAILGWDGEFFGNRGTEGIATAFLLGQVYTSCNYKTLTIKNETAKYHLLNPGHVTMQVYKEGNDVYVKVHGEGKGNFKRLNNTFGPIVFEKMIKRAAWEFNSL